MKLELLLSFIYSSCINALLADRPSLIQTSDGVISSPDPTTEIFRLYLIASAKQKQLHLNATCAKEVIHEGKKLLIKL